MPDISDFSDQIPETHDPAPRRKLTGKSLTLLVVVLAGAVALLASVQTWVDIRFFSGAASVESLEITGQKLSPALTLIALAALASALVLTIAGPLFRRVIGALLALLGAGLTTIGGLAVVDPLAGARGAIESVTGIAGDAQYGLVRATIVSMWPTVAALSGIALVVAGVWIMIVGGSWKNSGRKYQSAESVSRSAEHDSDSSDRISDWDALSDGDDPTS